jgi:hypothetical protein
MIPYMHQIGDLLERESLLTTDLERQYLQEKVKTLSTALEDLNKTNTPIVPLLKGLETGSAPGQGKIKEVAPEPQNRPRNPMQEMMEEMTKPESLKNMMGMVNSMMNPGSNSSGGGGLGGLGSMMSSMLGNMPGGLGGLMSNMMSGMGGRSNPPNISRSVSNASVDTNIPTLTRHMSNGGLISLNSNDLCKNFNLNFFIYN